MSNNAAIRENEVGKVSQAEHITLSKDEAKYLYCLVSETIKLGHPYNTQIAISLSQRLSKYV